MDFFKNLFGGGNRHTKLEVVDFELGKFNSNFVKGSNVTWIGNAQLFGKTIELLIDGNQDEISTIQKKIILTALSSE